MHSYPIGTTFAAAAGRGVYILNLRRITIIKPLHVLEKDPVSYKVKSNYDLIDQDTLIE